MEGWLYGLFTLAGVLVGGLFTYLGLRKQLEQQQAINKIEWRRKVRAKPLLKLREELATMATKLDRLAKSAHIATTVTSMTDDEQRQRFSEASTDWNTYISSSSLEHVLKTIDDAQIKKSVREIIPEYLGVVDYGTRFRNELSASALGQAVRKIGDIDAKVTEAQSLINKALEEL